jgi:hypothetical protein
MIGRVAAGLLFAALLVSGIRLDVLRLVLPPFRPADVPGPTGGVDRRPLRFKADPAPRDIVSFLEVVRAETKPGERVALLLAPPHDGFSYTYWRAQYILSGRPVQLPMTLFPPDDPDVIVVWDTGYGDDDYSVAWTAGNGAILRRKK